MTSENLADIVTKGLKKYKKSMVGAIIRPQQGNHVATKDAIRHFANGTGDLNPLWISEDYAKKSIYGDIIAPPFFLNAISEGQAILGLPGLISTFVGAEWEWHQVIRVNDAFAVTNQLLELDEKGGEEGQRRFLQSGVQRYSNQRGELVGSCKWNMMRTEMKLGGGGKKGGKKRSQPEAKAHQYSEKALSEIYKGIESEEIRGGKARYWEDVSEGDELGEVIKGPLSISDMIAWAIGTSWHRLELAYGAKLAHLRKKPGLAYKDPNTGAPEPIANSHFIDSAAQILMGSPLPIDLGMQRLTWFGHLVTNWMSDYGFLMSLSGRIREFVRFGDTNWCTGKIVKKFKENDKYLVGLALKSQNQRGDTTMTGEAVVALPAKSTIKKQLKSF
jgi:acyl dehydratase